MKKIICLLNIFMLLGLVLLAQAPQSFKYQAVARTSTGNLIQNQLVAFRISILQGGPSGTLLYQERHTTNTNNYGLANLDIGNGTVLSGTFSTIDWSAGTMFIKVEFDPLGGTTYQNMGTTQLLSVPYALYSKTSSELTLPYEESTSYGGYAFKLTNDLSSGISSTTTATSGNGIALYGESASSIGLGVNALASSPTGQCYGVRGQSNSSSGLGVLGHAASTTGTTYGVKGQNMSSTGYGVYGIAFSPSGTNYGVYGVSLSSSGYGVYGIVDALSGYNIGIYGESMSTEGYGVMGKASATSGFTRAIVGSCASPDGFSGYFGGGKFTITSSKVGLGTIYPDCQLHILSPGNADVMKIEGSSSFDYLFRFREASNGAGAFYIYDASVNNTIFLYGDGNSFFNSGNIGIGTTNPAYKLDVGGPINLNKGIASAIAMRVNSDEALWYNGTYFSWGYAGSYNFIGNKLKIAGNGNTAPTYELQVDGNAAKSLGGSSWIVSSDLRLKDLLGNYIKGLNEIMALQPVKFSYKSGNSRGLPSEVEQVGFIAQEVQKVFPEAINEGEDGLLDFNMHPINVALVNSIKELKLKIDKLEYENNQMRAENNRLNVEYENITARLERLETSMNLSAGK